MQGEFLTLDETKAQYWQQYWRLTKLRNETISVLRRLGESEFPEFDSPEIEKVKEQFSLTQLIREAVDAQEGLFSKSLIADYIKKRAPLISIDSLGALISQLARSEGWIIVESGTGTKPTLYRLKDKTLKLKLNDEEMSLIMEWQPKNRGAGGWQHLMFKILNHIDLSTNILSMTPDLLSIIHRYSSYSVGGFENRLIKLFSRSLGENLAKDINYNSTVVKK